VGSDRLLEGTVGHLTIRIIQPIEYLRDALPITLPSKDFLSLILQILLKFGSSLFTVDQLLCLSRSLTVIGIELSKVGGYVGDGDIPKYTTSTEEVRVAG
jgi:hypothetical protein